jgi:uncharacterized membrane protein YkvA (DUF1232 family)
MSTVLSAAHRQSSATLVLMSLDPTPARLLMEALQRDDIKQRLQEPRTEDAIKQGFPEAVESIKSQVGEIWDDLHTAYKMLFDAQFDLQPQYRAALIAAFGYLVSPIDIIPDIVPVLGLSDDVAVITLAVRFCKPEIERYRAFVAKTKQ